MTSPVVFFSSYQPPQPVKVQFVSQQVSEQKKSEKLCMHMRTTLQTFLCPAKERKRQAKCKRILLFPDFKAMFKR